MILGLAVEHLVSQLDITYLSLTKCSSVEGKTLNRPSRVCKVRSCVSLFFRCSFFMTPSTPISDSVSLSSSPSSTSSWNDNNTVLSRLAYTMRDTRMKVETKTLELNATMQEKLPEWKLRGAMYSNMARETGIEWSRRGKEAVDRWKKEFAGRLTLSLQRGGSRLCKL